jgi:hypothetical protein
VKRSATGRRQMSTDLNTDDRRNFSISMLRGHF